MKNLMRGNNGAWNLFSMRNKILLGTVAVFLGGFFTSQAKPLQSPRGAEVFGPHPSIVGPPTKKTVRIVWTYAVSRETPDLVFKLYHSTNLATAYRKWPLLTNIPGTSRSVTVPITQAREFFILTASNYLGESSYATR